MFGHIGFSYMGLIFFTYAYNSEFSLDKEAPAWI